ncbi:MAG: ABC transporter substrate-binding protein [Dehalococcoidia bacterium]
MLPTHSRFVWLVGALVVALAFVFAACDDEGDGGDDGTPGAEATALPSLTPVDPADIVSAEDVLAKDGAATNEDEVKWGFMFELSGGILEGFGVPTSDGVKMAVQEINDAGGFQVGDTVYTINLVEKDTTSSVPVTRAVTQELIQDDGVNVIWGPATLGEPEATQITQPQQVLHLCPCQQRETTALSSIEKARGESKWAFQTLLPFSLLIQQGARNFIEDWPEIKTMAMLCQDTSTGRDICGRTREAYTAVGIEIVSEDYFPAQTTDYNAYLTKIKQNDPDYLYNYNDPPGDAAIVRQALEQGVGRLLNVNVPANLVEALVGVPLTVPVIVGAAPRQHVLPTSEAAAAYFERYAAYKGGSLDGTPAAFVSLLTYDYVYMLVAAMQQAGTVEDTTAIADALEKVHYSGAAEDNMFFNSRHFGVHGTDPCIVEQDKPITCEHSPPPPEANY